MFVSQLSGRKFCLIMVQIRKLMTRFSRGHVAIIVNVASKCGFTATNYKELQELHDQYAESKGLRILAFPCNQFNGQVTLTVCRQYSITLKYLGLRRHYTEVSRHECVGFN
jgi:glutathione peroxidase-family protein